MVEPVRARHRHTVGQWQQVRPGFSRTPHCQPSLSVGSSRALFLFSFRVLRPSGAVLLLLEKEGAERSGQAGLRAPTARHRTVRTPQSAPLLYASGLRTKGAGRLAGRAGSEWRRGEPPTFQSALGLRSDLADPWTVFWSVRAACALICSSPL